MGTRTAIGTARATLLGVVLLAGALALGACTTESRESPPAAQASSPSTQEPISYVTDDIVARQELVDAIWIAQNLRETLPNVTFAIDGEPARALNDGVVLGRITEAHVQASFRHSRDAEQTYQLEPDSPDAWWRLMVVTVEVEDDFDPATETPGTVEVGFTFSPDQDSDRMRSALEGRKVFVVLGQPGRLESDPSLRMVDRNGTLFGLVDDDGSISMPGLAEQEAEFLADLRTVESISAAAEEPPTVIPVTSDNPSLREQ